LLYVCPSRALARPRRARSGRLSRRRVRGGPQAPLRGLDGIGRELDHPPLSLAELAYLVGLARRDHEQVARGDVPRLGPYSLPPAAPLEEGDREELVAVRPREDHLVVPVEPLDSYARGIRRRRLEREDGMLASRPLARQLSLRALNGSRCSAPPNVLCRGVSAGGVKRGVWHRPRAIASTRRVTLRARVVTTSCHAPGAVARVGATRSRPGWFGERERQRPRRPHHSREDRPIRVQGTTAPRRPGGRLSGPTASR
jgi:hypothetical protein